jgi:hypothetical protein
MDGWWLWEARAVLFDGVNTTIVGYGANPSGNTEAWLAQIPEPATGWLFGMALVALAALRLRITRTE